MSAVISECGQYRYVLKRKIPSVLRWNRPILFIMLNPSIADASKTDPTLRKILAMCDHHGYTDLTIVNLFALRSPHPKDLKNHPDPIGPENDKYIEQEYQNHFHTGTIVAAWGTNKFAKKRAEHISNRFGPFDCLGFNQDGTPRHPLFLPTATPLESFIKIEFDSGPYQTKGENHGDTGSSSQKQED